MRRRLLGLSLLLLAGAPARGLGADDVLVVLSADSTPYQEALAGFQETFGRPVLIAHLAEGPLHYKGQPRVIITFGGKAAHLKYPDASILIYGLAPGTHVSLTEHPGLAVQVSMMPKPSVMLEKLRGIQPQMKHLTVLWTSPSFEIYTSALRREGPAHAMEIQADKLEKPDDLPARLRDLQNRTDAVWLPPDPLLMSGENIVVITQFSQSKHIPFYSAVPGLMAQGAVASLSSSFSEIGHTAGRAALSAVNGVALPGEVYPDAAEVLVNAESAAKAGLELPKGMQTGVQKVNP